MRPEVLPGEIHVSVGREQRGIVENQRLLVTRGCMSGQVASLSDSRNMGNSTDNTEGQNSVSGQLGRKLCHCVMIQVALRLLKWLPH